MCLRYSFNKQAEADLLEQAVDQVLAKNIRTTDIAAAGIKPVSTSEMGSALLESLEEISSENT